MGLHIDNNQSRQNIWWRAVLSFLRDVLVIFGIAIVVSFMVKTFLVRSFFIPSASMQQTLQIDDRVIVNELVPRVVPLEHGDIVVFRDPGGWLLASSSTVQTSPLQQGAEWMLSLFGLASPDSNDHLIKRVIGLPGDTVQCCSPDGKIIVNGMPVTEPYLNLPPGEKRASGVNFNVTVPANSVFVMGDNRYNSKDSRFNTDKPGGGFVSYDDIVGRAFVVSWPVKNWAWLPNYAQNFASKMDTSILNTPAK